MGFSGEDEVTMSIRYFLITLPLVGAGLLALVGSNSPMLASMMPSGNPARLDVTWRVERGDHAYRLLGRYSIASVTGDFATSIASDPDLEATTSQVYIPKGLYSITLEPGYTLERVAAHARTAALGASDGAAVEAVPASLVSPNPLVVMAQPGGSLPIGLSLIDMPGTALDPTPTCMNGS
jgi:hypothetical protein